MIWTPGWQTHKETSLGGNGYIPIDTGKFSKCYKSNQTNKQSHKTANEKLAHSEEKKTMYPDNGVSVFKNSNFFTPIEIYYWKFSGLEVFCQHWQDKWNKMWINLVNHEHEH